MNIYAIYYIDEGDRYYFMQRKDAMQCGIDYIHRLCADEHWDPQETESLVNEFLRNEWVADICALDVIDVKE